MKRHTHASSVSPISYSRLLIRKLTSPFFPAVGTMKTPMNDCDDRGCYNYELKKIFNLARLLNPNGLWNKSVHPFDDMRYKQLFQDEIGECGAHPVALQSPDRLAQLVVSERHDYRPAAAVRPTPPHKRQRYLAKYKGWASVFFIEILYQYISCIFFRLSNSIK